VIPEIDIWRAAQLMRKRHGDQAEAESATRVGELEAAGDHEGAAVWRRITSAVTELVNTTARPPPLTGRSLRDNPVYGVAITNASLVESIRDN
jgi:hypothetical protein